MKVAFRAVAVSVLLSLAWAGPLAPFAAAQQPTTPPAEQPTTPPAEQRTTPPAEQPTTTPAPVQMYQEDVKATPERQKDAYDTAATALTVVGMPFKAALCALGFVFGGALFVVSGAARPDAAFGILDEGCGTKARWVVRGDELRPLPSPTKAFEWEAHRFNWER
jgi:hypothetical protein